MNETKDVTVKTSARISLATARSLRQQRLRLAALLGREVSNDEVIQAMHDVFVEQPITVVIKAVQP
ncbi:MAG TPA: hypothetical protein PL187_04095 [Caldilinea sp.]|nr:hypothetical protein [Caldilinea sp.]